MHSLNARQEGRVVLSIVSESESQTTYLHGFRELKLLESEHWSRLKMIISDFKHSPILAYQKLEGRPIEHWCGCEWEDFITSGLSRVFLPIPIFNCFFFALSLSAHERSF